MACTSSRMNLFSGIRSDFLENDQFTAQISTSSITTFNEDDNQQRTHFRATLEISIIDNTGQRSSSTLVHSLTKDSLVPSNLHRLGSMFAYADYRKGIPFLVAKNVTQTSHTIMWLSYTHGSFHLASSSHHFVPLNLSFIQNTSSVISVVEQDVRDSIKK